VNLFQQNAKTGKMTGCMSSVNGTGRGRGARNTGAAGPGWGKKKIPLLRGINVLEQDKTSGRDLGRPCVSGGGNEK